MSRAHVEYIDTLSSKASKDFKFCKTTGEILRFNGVIWVPNSKCEYKEYAKTYSQDFELSTRTAMEFAKLALNNADIRVEDNIFDQHPYLIAFNDRVIDALTGQPVPDSRELYLTQTCGEPYAPELVAPTWERFFDEFCGSNAELTAYLQGVIGYCFLGKIDRKEFYYIHGQSNTGKSTFAETIVRALGDYATTVDASVFLHKKFGDNAGDQASKRKMKGKRFVLGTEFNSNDTIDVEYLKIATSDEILRAKLMRENPTQYYNVSKIMFTANVPIPSENIPEGLQTRMRVIPGVNIPVIRDNGLRDKLRLEQTAITNTFARYAQAYCRNGIPKCYLVEEQTAEMIATQCPLNQFLIETYNYDRKSTSFVNATELLNKVNAWLDGNSDGKRYNHTTLGREMSKQGYKHNKKTGYLGFSPKIVDASQEMAKTGPKKTIELPF